MSKPNLTLSHNAYPYNSKGQRMNNYLGFTYIKKNTTINYYGTKTIKGKKYYYIGDGAYIKSGNVGTVRGSVAIKPHATVSPVAEQSLSMPRGGENTILLINCRRKHGISIP
ncbi:SLAP domain-containing protein [Lactobacillus helveticus]|nr:SLAP domain-containing protein [Lactobacillus helveticus]